MWGNPEPLHCAKSIENILRKDKYWHSQLRKTFLIDLLTTNSAIHHNSLILKNDLSLSQLAFFPFFIEYPTHAVLFDINFVVFL